MLKIRMRIRGLWHLNQWRWHRVRRTLSLRIQKVFGGEMPCKDCYIETYHFEVYWLVPGIWEEANKVDTSGWKGKGYLCIGCIEKRLGRSLTEEDFEFRPIPTPGIKYDVKAQQRNTSERLKSRRGW